MINDNAYNMTGDELSHMASDEFDTKEQVYTLDKWDILWWCLFMLGWIGTFALLLYTASLHHDKEQLGVKLDKEKAVAQKAKENLLEEQNKVIFLQNELKLRK